MYLHMQDMLHGVGGGDLCWPFRKRPQNFLQPMTEHILCITTISRGRKNYNNFTVHA